MVGVDGAIGEAVKTILSGAGSAVAAAGGGSLAATGSVVDVRIDSAVPAATVARHAAATSAFTSHGDRGASAAGQG